MSLSLTDAELRTLIEMGIRHPHSRARRRAQGLVRLAQGVSQVQLAREYGVHLNSVRYWLRAWNARGLVGLFEGHRSGRPPKYGQRAPAPQQRIGIGGMPQPVAERPRYEQREIVC